jgi:hypothetical protein
VTEELNKTNLLTELESRQDELLRLLGELEERTKAALASLTAAPKPTLASAEPAQENQATPSESVARKPARGRKAA